MGTRVLEKGMMKVAIRSIIPKRALDKRNIAQGVDMYGVA
jgi:hypothetical protein